MVMASTYTVRNLLLQEVNFCVLKIFHLMSQQASVLMVSHRDQSLQVSSHNHLLKKSRWIQTVMV